MKDIDNCDIALIHPPHIFNTQSYAIFPLPWNLGNVGSTSYVGKYLIGPSWNKMPIGFYSMKDYVEDNSKYAVKIINLAALKFSLPKNVFEKFRHIQNEDKSILVDLADGLLPNLIINTIKGLRANLFAVDLHWLNYAQGAIQILKLIKKIHPDSYTVVGGLTASYFNDEITRLFTFIDFLIIGDGCIPLLELIRQVKTGKDFSRVPNLIWRKKGIIKKGPKYFLNDFEYVQNKKINILTIPTSRGCPLQCITCGGSKYASKKLSKYRAIKIYSVESIMKKLFMLAKEEEGEANIFLIHDPFLTIGRKNWETLLDEVKINRLRVNFLIEFFVPHSKEDIFNIAKKIPNSSIHISPESINAGVRAFQKNLRYENKELIMNMNCINNIKELSMHVWFMGILAKDTRLSIDENLIFIRNYYKKLKNTKKDFIKYNELLFIDPGSLAFDFQKKYGYELINKTFLSHMESFIMPIFKYQINYRTKYFNRDQIFDLILYIHTAMNKIYYENDIIDRRKYERINLYNRLLKKYSFQYDSALEEKDIKIRKAFFENIGGSFRNEIVNFN